MPRNLSWSWWHHDTNRTPSTSARDRTRALRLPLTPLRLATSLAVAAALAVPAAASTAVPGATITTAVTWTVGGSPYIVQGWLTVAGGGSLTIGAGVQVRFVAGTGITVQDGGTLTASGAAGQTIALTSDAASPQAGDWYYIDANAGSHLRLTHCDLAYAGRNGNPALFLRGADAQVRSSSLHHFAGTGINIEGGGNTSTVADTTVTTTTGWAIYQNTMNMAPRYNNVTLAGGGVRAPVVDGDTVSGSVTLDGTAARFVGGAPIILSRSTYVPAGSTLTVVPGTELRTPPGGAFEVREGGTMIAISLLALAANVVCLRLIARHRDGEVHMRASYIFTANDVLANLGVIVAGLLVGWVGQPWPDWLIGALIGLLVLAGAVRILRLR